MEWLRWGALFIVTCSQACTNEDSAAKLNDNATGAGRSAATPTIANAGTTARQAGNAGSAALPIAGNAGTSSTVQHVSAGTCGNFAFGCTSIAAGATSNGGSTFETGGTSVHSSLGGVGPAATGGVSAGGGGANGLGGITQADNVAGNAGSNLPNHAGAYGSLSTEVAGSAGTAQTGAAGFAGIAGGSGTAGTSSAALPCGQLGTGTVLLDLGHATRITYLKVDGSRVLSQDADLHWVLWDYVSGAMLASGNSTCLIPPNGSCDYSKTPLPIDLAGPVVVIAGPSGLEVRASSDGHILSSIPAPLDWWTYSSGAFAATGWWKVAPDGSYVAAGFASGLVVWSPTGEVLLSRPGDYSAAKPFTAPDEIRIALGPAGPSAIETIGVATGIAVVSPAFSGQFHSWFEDGALFLTNVGTTIRTYSKTTHQEWIASLPSVTGLKGIGNWIVADGSYFRVGGSGNAIPPSIVDGATAVPSSSIPFIGTWQSSPGVLVVTDLSDESPTSTEYTLEDNFSASAFAAKSGEASIIGGDFGIIQISATFSERSVVRNLGCGATMSVSGGGHRVAVATASGNLIALDVRAAAVEAVIDFPFAVAQLSSDGTTLAAAPLANRYKTSQDYTLRVFSLPSKLELHNWPHTGDTNSQPLLDFSLSASGNAISQTLTNGGTPPNDGLRLVTDIAGTSTLWSLVHGDVDYPTVLSPDGTTGAVVFTSGNDEDSITNIYSSGVLTTAVPGIAVAWLDNNRLLVNEITRVGHVAASAVKLYEKNGVLITTTTLPNLWPVARYPSTFKAVVQVLSDGDAIYSSEFNKIYSLPTGSAIWATTTSSRGMGAIAGSHVVFASGNRVLAEPI